MRFKKQVVFLIMLIMLSTLLVTVSVLDKPTEAETNVYDLAISGLVDHPINYTYSQLQSFPMVSEVARLQCVADPKGRFAKLYNWTGIPIFFLLNATGVEAGATKVVFYGSDGYSSDQTIERALHPTTLLALQANGTASDYLPCLVVPCQWGYKWVNWVTKIEVVDYDYKGSYESAGFPDDADIPGCALPSTTPPYEAFHILLATRPYSVITLSNSTINSFNFTIGEQICFKASGSVNTTSYCYFAIPKELLKCNNPMEWQIWVNKKLIEDRNIIKIGNYTYLYFTFNQESQEAIIIVTISNASELTLHDIGVIYAATSKTILGQGYNLNITVTTLNYDNNTETRTLTVYANTTAIASQNVTLTRKNATTSTFTWNTTGFAKGKYTISAYATPVPGETDTADNTYTNGIVTIAMVGDITGSKPDVPDGIVDITDIATVASYYGSQYPDSRYKPNCDINNDLIIDITDIATVAKNYGKTDP